MRIFSLVGLLATAAFAEAPAAAPPATAPARAVEAKAAPAAPEAGKGEALKAAAAKPDAAKTDAAKTDAAKDEPEAAAAAKPGDEAAENAAKIQLPPATPTLAPSPSGPRVDLPVSPKEEAPEEDLDFGWMLVRTLVVLGIVIMLVYLSLNFGLRKLMGLRAPVPGASVVQVLERVPLDNKHGLFVVRAAGEYLLIGGGDGNLQLIAKLSNEEVERLRSETKAPALTLSPLLQKLLGRRDTNPPATKGSNG